MLQEVNLEDTENVMASKGLLEFAVSSGLYDPSSGRPFSFFQAFMDKNTGQRTYSHPRVRKLQELYSGAKAALAAAGTAAEVSELGQPAAEAWYWRQQQGCPVAGGVGRGWGSGAGSCRRELTGWPWRSVAASSG